MVCGPVDSGTMVRQNIVVVGACARDYSLHGEQKQRETKEPNMTFKNMPPVTYFLKLDSRPIVSTISQNSATNLETKCSTDDPMGNIS
jgi:hypothetical protein